MKGRAALAWILGVMLLMNIGCSRGRKETSKREASVFKALATRELIDGLSREQLAGKRLFAHYCVVCHAASGKGDGFNAYNLKSSFGVTPADLTGTEAPLSLDQLKQIISQGGASAGKSKYMPSWGGIMDESRIHAVARYVQSFKQPESATPAASK